MARSSNRWSALACVGALALCGCGRSQAQLGAGVEASDGTRYYWTTGEATGSRRLWREQPAAGEPAVIDEGVFVNVIGPLLSPGGAAWAVLVDGDWTVRQVGTSESVARRGQGVGDALGAAWLLERVSSGHSPGNAADLVRIGELARSGRWPE